MPEKTIREMSSIERSHHSLEAKTFRATVIGCVVLGLVLLVIGLGLYSVTVTRQYVSQAFYLSQTAAQSAGHGADSIGLANRVMATYRAMSDEERAGTGTDAYRARFAAEEASGEYDVLIHMLAGFSRNIGISDVYLAMYDEETCAMVYIVDPDDIDRLYPGEWERVSEKGMRKFLDWDGEGMLYDIDRPEKYGWMCTAGTPLRDSEGTIRAFVLVDVTIDNVLNGIRAYALQITAALILVIALLSWAMIRYMKKNLVEPINRIAEAAKDYVQDRRAGVRETEHFSLLNIRTGDQVENLSLVMADMERDLADYEENLTAVTAEKERIGAELSLARTIQENSIPNIFPPFPDRTEFDIYASMDPAREVGGDFYNFFLTDADHLAMVIGDVSGKGIPAALFMMVTNILISDRTHMGGTPAEILAFVNDNLYAHNQADMFVTVWLGILELSTGKLTAANAGHEYPVLKKPDGGFEFVRDRHGFVLGGMDGMRYRDYELALEPGAKLFLYTDGVPEATDAKNALFGKERMLAALNASPDERPEQILRSVRSAVDGFVQEAEQFDDLTMLCLEYKGDRTEETT